MLPGGSRITCMILDMFPGLDLYCTDPEQHLTTAGREWSRWWSIWSRSWFIWSICPMCGILALTNTMLSKSEFLTCYDIALKACKGPGSRIWKHGKGMTYMRLLGCHVHMIMMMFSQQLICLKPSSWWQNTKQATRYNTKKNISME